MMRECVYISTICDIAEDEATHGLRYVSRAAKTAARFGFGLELAEYCLSENMDDDAKVRSHFEANVSASQRRLLHAPYNELYPHAIDSKAVALAWDRYVSALKICERAGCTKLIVHANYVQALYHPLWFVDRQIIFWKRFLAQIDPSVEICLENVMEPEPRLLYDIVEAVADVRLTLCLDVGHANLMPVKPDRWLEMCGKHISHFHLHNNGGPIAGDWPAAADTHRALGCGCVDMEALLRESERIVPNATYTLETNAAKESALWLIEKGFV